MALLMLAGLMVRSLIAVESVPIPFEPDRTLGMFLPATQARYPTPESRAIFDRALLDNVQAIPGVKSATMDDSFPVMGLHTNHVQIAGQQVDTRRIALHLTGPEFLAISGRHILRATSLTRARSPPRPTKPSSPQTSSSATSPTRTPSDRTSPA